MTGAKKIKAAILRMTGAWIEPQPAAATAAPAKPPIKVCDEEDGMPYHHVKRFQTMAAMTPERIIGKVMNWE